MTRITPNLTLGFVDLKNIFNDISTGYTPTNEPPDQDFRDFSKLENLDTPTPLESTDCENTFAYAINSVCTDQLTPASSAAEPLHYCQPEPCSTETNYSVAFGTTDGYLLTPQHTSQTICYPSPNQESKVVHSTPQQAPNTLEYAFYTPISSMDCQCTAQRDVQPLLAYNHSLTVNVSSPPLYSDVFQGPNGSSCGTYTNTYCPKTPVHSNPTSPPVNPPAKTKHDIYDINQIKRSDSPNPKATKFLEKAFSCDYPNCIKRFARVDELKRHQRTHSDVKQFVCDICQKGFTRSDHLMTHRRTHTGERPYPCEHCERRFARSDERNRHMKVHLREKTRRPRRPRGSKLKVPSVDYNQPKGVPTMWFNNLSLGT